MDVLVHDTQVNPDAFTVAETRATLVTLADLLRRSDFVTAHVPEAPATIKLFNDERFALMKPSAFFINTSRGKIVDEDALVRALREKRIAGAGLDVRGKEPPAPGALEEMDNVILTPHVAAFTEEGQARVVTCVCRDVAAVLRGEPAKNFFNFALPRR
jgi:D-3-phosphoglycerate dehydrogenase / 2-oxoglutarate reductase